MNGIMEYYHLAFSPLIIIILALNCQIGQCANLSSLLIFQAPGIHLWSNQSDLDFNPYRTISKHRRTFSEYILHNELDGTFFLSLIFYDKDLEIMDVSNMTDDVKKKVLQDQNEAKEYYWEFFNSTGILPSVTYLNTTFEIEFNFFTIANDFIRYDLVVRRSSRTGALGELTVPPYDLTIEVPANTRSFTEKRIAIQIFTWSYLRWRLSTAKPVTWDKITQDLSLNGTRKPSPEEIQLLINPCIPDTSVFSLITKSASGGVNHVYFIVPLLEQKFWNNITSGFCSHIDVPDECGSVSQVIMTNNYILGLSNLGLYVSVQLNSTFNRNVRLDPELLPIVDFRLYNPCSEVKDLLICFDSPNETADPSIEKMELFYTPVCHMYQLPNYRDIVILAIFHVGQPSGNSSTGPAKCLTVLFANAPYSKFDILIKCIDKYMEFPIVGLAGIFYHHQLNRFDLVIGYENTNTSVQHYVRILLPMPDSNDSKPYYDMEKFGQGGKFQAFDFPPAFVVKKVQVFPGSMDVFFLGNQLFIAESGGELVYNSVSNFAAADELDYCSFNHPDRTFICLNDAHTIVLVGKVGTEYGMREVFTADIKEIQEVAIKEKWIPAGTSPSGSTGPTTSPAFSHLRFTMSFGGTIQMWFIKGFEYPGAPTPTPPPAGIVSSDDEPGVFNLVNIDPLTIQFVSEISHGPLVPFILDAITVILYEAVVDLADQNEETEVKSRYISRVNVGNSIRCVNNSMGNATNTTTATNATIAPTSNEFSCNLYIRHMKQTHRRLIGFRSVLYTFVDQSIPMNILACDYTVTVAQESNKVALSGDCSCLGSNNVGQTIYIPDKFSILIVNGNTSTNASGGCPEGLATRKANAEEKYDISSSTSYLIDMSTKEYRNESGGRQSWIIQGGECIFRLALIPNDVMRTSGGHIILDLQDSISFTVTLTAKVEKAQLALQRPLILLSNSNADVLQVNTQIKNFERHQRMDIFLRPTGFGVGIASIVVRSFACSVKCTSSCSLTFIFQVMLREGRALQIRYPTPNQDGDDTAEAAEDRLIQIPENYRPPSSRGVKIPQSRNIYNAYPEHKPRLYDYYGISQETGVYKQCLHKSTRKECNCSPQDIKNDNPIFSDCKEKVFRVTRARDYSLRMTYPPVMKDSKQNPKFFLPRQHLSVDVTEVNGRTEYKIESMIDEYLTEINKDKDLNLGNRFYSADRLNITCYGTGLFHFKVSLGHFDSFGDVTGYFMLFSVETGLHDATYMIVMFIALTCCMIFLFCGFFKVRKRLILHLPIHGDTNKIKME